MLDPLSLSLLVTEPGDRLEPATAESCESQDPQVPSINRTDPTTNLQQSPSDVQQPPSDVQKSPSDVQQSPSDVQQPSSDVQQSPSDVQQPPSDVQQPPSDVQQPPSDIQQPPSDVQRSPSDVQQSDTQQLSPGKQQSLSKQSMVTVDTQELQTDQHKPSSTAAGEEGKQQDLLRPDESDPRGLEDSDERSNRMAEKLLKEKKVTAAPPPDTPLGLGEQFIFTMHRKTVRWVYNLLKLNSCLHC